MTCQHSLILLSWPRIARPFMIDILSRILCLVPFCLVPEFRVSSLLTRSPYHPFFPPSLAHSYWIPLYLLLLNIPSAVSPTLRPSLSCDPGSSQAQSMALLPSSLVVVSPYVAASDGTHLSSRLVSSRSSRSHSRGPILSSSPSSAESAPPRVLRRSCKFHHSESSEVSAYFGMSTLHGATCRIKPVSSPSRRRGLQACAPVFDTGDTVDDVI